jgi:hypothetical protein
MSLAIPMVDSVHVKAHGVIGQVSNVKLLAVRGVQVEEVKVDALVPLEVADSTITATEKDASC